MLYRYFNTNKVRDSIISIRRFLKVNRKFPPAYALLSNIYSEYFNNYKAAILLNEEGYKYLPHEASIINNLTYSYLMNDEIDKAEEMLKNAKDTENNIFLNATRGLFNIKRGNIEEGRRLYNLAAQLARDEILYDLVLQKKYLELGRYYLNYGENKKAKSNIDKVFAIARGKDTIFTIHAKELREKIK